MHFECGARAVWTLLDPPPMRLQAVVAVVCAAFALVACGEPDGDGDGPEQARQLEKASVAAGESGGASNGASTGAGAGAAAASGGGARGRVGDDDGGAAPAPTEDGASSSPPAAGCGGSAAQPAQAAMVSGYIDTLPYAPANDAKRAQIIDAILRTCEVFAPPSATGFQKKHCYAHLAAAIHKESTYSPTVAVTDSYATRAIGNAKANDPTVGLLQIRFSSTVHDFVAHGPASALSCVGCNLPAALASHVNEGGDSSFWAVTGPTDYRSVLTSPACNVPLGAWYYYVNATGNGNATATTYIDGYCNGKGTSANLITGLRSHLNGPSGGRGVIADASGLSALQTTDGGGYQYVTTIKSWFDVMVGPSAGKHPFFFSLAPADSEYCR